MNRTFVVIAMTALLAACGNQQASYEITDRNHSLSVTRDQAYPGAKWDTWLIVARFPECQRRYALAQSGDKFKMDLYRVEPGVFILNQAKLWYVVETKECRQQKYDTAPPEPGDLIGTFLAKDEQLVYVNKDDKAADSADKGGGQVIG